MRGPDELEGRAVPGTRRDCCGSRSKRSGTDHVALDALKVQKNNVFDGPMGARVEAAAFWGHWQNPVKICSGVHMVGI